jgi:hypothetical protein
MGNGPYVGSPLVEGFLVLGQKTLTNTVRNLSVTEKLLLRNIFKDSINYDKVQIATTNVGAEGRPYTFANTIRIPPHTDFNTQTLVHEATHVWQYQTKGSGYISDSAWHQLVDKSAYSVTLIPRQSLSAYTAEQQAVIVEGYYVDQQANPVSPAKATTYDRSQVDAPPLGWSLLLDVVRMIAELQRTRPISDQAKYEERLFGPGGVPKQLPGSPNIDPVVPILRIEF